MKFSSIDIRDLHPYGTPMLTSTGVSANPYKYGGKEFETEEGLKQYDFEARSLIPQIGMFTSQDPNAANYPWLNPYLYCAANPMKYIDPTGEEVTVVVGAVPVGTTSIYLYTSAERKKHKINGDIRTNVPVFNVNIYNESGSSNNYYYTRVGYRKDINNQDGVPQEVTFDVRNDGDSFSGVIRDRWDQKNNVLEIRDKITGSQSVNAKRGRNEEIRTAIQFHVLGATDGCLMSVGKSGFTKIEDSYTIRADLPGSSSQAQKSFMSDLLNYINEDLANKKTGTITIIFQQLYE